MNFYLSNISLTTDERMRFIKNFGRTFKHGVTDHVEEKNDMYNLALTQMQNI